MSSRLSDKVNRLSKQLEAIQGQDMESRKIAVFMAACTTDELRAIADRPEGEPLPEHIQKKLKEAGLL